MSDKLQHYLRLLPDSYARTLEAVDRTSKKKGKKMELLKEATTEKAIRRMERWFSRQVEQGEVPYGVLYKLPWLWYNATWTPSERMVLALVKRYAALANGTDGDATEADGYVKAVTDRLYGALNHQSPTTMLYYNTLGHFNLPNGYYTASVSTAGLATALFMANRIPLQSQYLATEIAQGNIPFGDLVSLPARCYASHVKPSVKVLAAMVRRYRLLALADCALAPEATDYLIRLQRLLNKAQHFNMEKVRVRYNTISNFPADNNYYYEMFVETLASAMPHPYLTALMQAKQQGHYTATLSQQQKNEIMKLDIDYAEEMTKGRCPFKLMTMLPKLWDAIGWVPSWQLVLAMAKRYRTLADGNGTDSEQATALVLRLKDALEKSKQRGEERAYVPYTALSQRITKCKYYKLMTMDSLEKALTQQIE